MHINGSSMTPMSCLSAPDRCVSPVGTAEVLDQENEEFEANLIMNINRLYERDKKTS